MHGGKSSHRPLIYLGGHIMKELKQTPSAIERRAKSAAWHYFGYKKRNHKGLVLHHVDPTLKYNDPQRYHEWLPEDLVVMDKGEHTRLHKTGKSYSYTTKSRGWRRKSSSDNGCHKYKLNQPQRRAVMCVETGKKYISRKEAERETGCYYKSISKCCDGLRETTGGYHWK